MTARPLDTCDMLHLPQILHSISTIYGLLYKLTCAQMMCELFQIILARYNPLCIEGKVEFIENRKILESVKYLSNCKRCGDKPNSAFINNQQRGSITDTVPHSSKLENNVKK